MGITRKIDRAFQWAGEKLGAEAKTTVSEDFKMLETEMALRQDGMERLHRSMNAYVKWLGRRGESLDDKDKSLPVGFLARAMLTHGEDFEPDSDFGNCLVALGRANEEICGIQEQYLADATTTWLESLERSLAMMKEYQSARKKLENRRLAYDASMSKIEKAKREDFRLEEELRTCKAKHEESSEDVLRRMQDIKEAEANSVRDLTQFLDAELTYHERCAEELRRVRQDWAGGVTSSSPMSPRRPSTGYSTVGAERRVPGRSRSNTAYSLTERLSRTRSREEPEPEPEPEMSRLVPVPSTPSRREPPDVPLRPSIGRASTYQASERERDPARVPRSYSGATTPSSPSVLARESYFGNQPAAVQSVSALRGQLRPVHRGNAATSSHGQDVFADGDDDTASTSEGIPEWGERSASPATSFGSLNRSTSNLAGSAFAPSTATTIRKGPPPPPPSRAKKPPPPLPAKREIVY